MKQKIFHTKFGIVAIAAGALLSGMFLVFTYDAFAFVGPTQAPPGGNGAVGSDALNNISVGTSTTISGTKFLVVGASNTNGTYSAQFLKNDGTPIFMLRDDGAVSIETSTVTAGTTVIGGALTIGGNFTANQVVGSINASLVTSGAFPGGNYTFPSNVLFPGSGIWNSSGNVGIGTPTPADTLDVNGNLGVLNGNNLRLYSSGNGSYASMNFNGATVSENYPLSLADGLTVAGANVGIGTTAPASMLSVGGVGVSGAAIYATGTIYGLYASGANFGVSASGATGVIGIGTSTGVSGQGGAAGIYGSGTTYGVQAYSAAGIGVYSQGGTYGVYSNGTTSATAYCINGANCITSWPSGGSGGVTSVFGRTGVVTATSGDYTVAQVTGAAPLASPTFTGLVTAPSFVGSLNASNVTSGEFGNGSGNYTFGGTSNVYFPGSGIWNASGNVGIGTTSPGAPLSVVGNGTFTGNLGLGAGGIVSSKLLTISDVASPSTYTQAGAQGIQVVAASGGGIYMSQVSGAYGKYEAYGGELGVGTMNAFPLGLYANNTERVKLSTAGGLSIGSGYVSTDAGANNVIIQGNVGIGTTSSAYPLSVNGQVNATGYCLSGTNCITSFPSIATTSKSIYDNSPTATDDLPFTIDMQGAVTLKSVECVNDAVTGNTFTFNIVWGTTRNSATSQAFTSNQTCTSITTPTILTPNSATAIPAGSIVRLVMSAASSTGATVQIEY